VGEAKACMADSRTPVERGIHAASPSEFFEPLEIRTDVAF